MIAITRAISDALAKCQLTHQGRVPIDVERARAQHAVYCEALKDANYRVIELPASPDHPDCVFIEDAAVVFDEVAVMTRPGAESRRGERPPVEEALRPLREIERIESPGTVDGGDVLTIGRRVFVGLSSRTNAAGIEQLARILAPHGYSVAGVEVTGCLHLKSAATAIDERRALIHPGLIDRRVLKGIECVEIDQSEPDAANLVALPGAPTAGSVLHGAAYPKTGERLRAAGLHVIEIPADELAKAEGALSCCSLILG